MSYCPDVLVEDSEEEEVSAAPVELGQEEDSSVQAAEHLIRMDGAGEAPVVPTPDITATVLDMGGAPAMEDLVLVWDLVFC